MNARSTFFKQYVDPGATAMDNVDDSETLTASILSIYSFPDSGLQFLDPPVLDMVGIFQVRASLERQCYFVLIEPLRMKSSQSDGSI